MRTKAEFIEKLRSGIDNLYAQYESGAEENGTEGLKLFSEYKILFDRYIRLIDDSEFDYGECYSSLMALSAVCQKRIDTIASIPVDCNIEVSDDMSLETTKEEILKTLHSLKTGISANIVKGNITVIISEVLKPTKEEMEKVKEKLSRLEDVKGFLEDCFSEYDFELGCNKADAILLEELMGEFPEFDELLR